MALFDSQGEPRDMACGDPLCKDCEHPPDFDNVKNGTRPVSHLKCVDVPAIFTDGQMIPAILGRRLTETTDKKGRTAKKWLLAHFRGGNCPWHKEQPDTRDPEDANNYVIDADFNTYPDCLLKHHMPSLKCVGWCIDHCCMYAGGDAIGNAILLLPKLGDNVTLLPARSRLLNMLKDKADQGDQGGQASPSTRNTRKKTAPKAEPKAECYPTQFSQLRRWVLGAPHVRKHKDQRVAPMDEWLRLLDTTVPREAAVKEVFEQLRVSMRMHLRTAGEMAEEWGDDLEVQCGHIKSIGEKLFKLFHRAFLEELGPQASFKSGTHYYMCHLHDVHRIMPLSASRSEGDEQMHHQADKVIAKDPRFEHGGDVGEGRVESSAQRVVGAHAAMRRLELKEAHKKALKKST